MEKVNGSKVEATPNKEATPGDLWGFAFSQRIGRELVPNGFARLSFSNPRRVSRIPYLSEQMVEAAINGALEQHNHYVVKLFALTQKSIDSLSKLIVLKELEHIDIPFYKFKQRRNNLERLIELRGKREGIEEVQRIMGGLLPDNVVKKPAESL